MKKSPKLIRISPTLMPHPSGSMVTVTGYAHTDPCRVFFPPRPRVTFKVGRSKSLHFDVAFANDAQRDAYLGALPVPEAKVATFSHSELATASKEIYLAVCFAKTRGDALRTDGGLQTLSLLVANVIRLKTGLLLPREMVLKALGGRDMTVDARGIQRALTRLINRRVKL